MAMLTWYKSIIDNNIFAFNPITTNIYRKIYYNKKTGLIDIYMNDSDMVKTIQVHANLTNDKLDIIAYYIFDTLSYIDKYEMLHTT